MKWIAFIVCSCALLFFIIAWTGLRNWLMLPFSPKRRKARKALRYWLAVRDHSQGELNKAIDNIRKCRGYK